MSIFFPDDITPINELKIINKDGQEEKVDDEELDNDEYTLNDDNNDENNPPEDQTANNTQQAQTPEEPPTEPEPTTAQQTEENPPPEDLEEPTPDDGESEFDNEENDNTSEFDNLDVEENPEGGDQNNPEGDTGGEEEPPPDDGASELDNVDGAGDDNSEGDVNDTSTDTIGSTGGANPELQDAENQIFSDLTPEQLQIRVKELKNNYFELYKSLLPIIDRVNNIPKITKNVKIIEYILTNLNKLQEMIPYYLNNTFDTKTYIENDINYQQYLVVINTINKILKQISSKTDNNDE